MTSCKLATAFEILNRLENIDARHCFTCCQSCGSAELQSLEDPDDETIGYCFYHAQDADAVQDGAELYLSFGAYETPEEVWISENIAYIIQETLRECGLDVEWNGNGDMRLKVLLDDESIEYARAWADGFAHGERVAYDWKYFDFDKEWDRFAKHWYSDEIQSILKQSVDDFEIDKTACGTSDMRQDSWEKGNALWQLSRTYYSTRIYQDDIMSGSDNPYRLYKRSMSQVLPGLCVGDEEDFLDSNIGTRIVYSLASQKTCLQSLIFTNEEPFDESLDEWDHKDLPEKMTDPFECIFFSFAGRAVLHNALKAVAKLLFPGQNVFEVCGHDNVELVVLPYQTIIFDLYGYYFSEHEKWSGFSIDNVVDTFRLNQMKSEFD